MPIVLLLFIFILIAGLLYFQPYFARPDGVITITTTTTEVGPAVTNTIVTVTTTEPITIFKQTTVSNDVANITMTESKTTISNQSYTTTFGFNTTYTRILDGSTEIKVYFPSVDNCTDQIVQLIDRANSTLKIAIYSFTLEPIANAIIRANDRGVNIKIIIEPTQDTQYSVSGRLISNGIQVFEDHGSGIMHDKVMIVDSTYVVTGSFNWSNNAQDNNAENLLIIRNQSVVRAYEDEWERLMVR